MRKKPQRLKHKLEEIAAYTGAAPLRIPPFDTAREIGARIGRVAMRTPRAARLIERNLDWVLPGASVADRKAIAAGVGDNFGRLIVEYARMAEFARQTGARRAPDVDALRAVVAQGRGAIIASAHIGNWEAIRLAARDAGVEVGIIYRAFNNPYFDRVSMTLIREAGAPVLHKGRKGLRAMVAHLRKGGAMLVLVDQRATGGAALPFLGRDALTATAIAGMARKLGAPLLPAVALRDATGRGFDIRFEPDITRENDLETMRALNHRISDWVREAPGQWFWLHQRWRARSGAGFLGADER